MTASEHTDGALRRYLRIAWRQKALVVVCLVLVPVAAVYITLAQTPRYEAEAEVLLARRSLAASLAGVPDPLANQSPDRMLETLRQLARLPHVAERALDDAGVDGWDAEALLAASDVETKPNADLLVFRVQSTDPDEAMQLATAYAGQFSTYRTELDAAALDGARADIEQQLEQLEQADNPQPELLEDLGSLERQLRALQAVDSSSAQVVQEASTATQVWPRADYAGVAGVLLGLMLGMGLALAREAAAGRTGSRTEIHELLRLPIIGVAPSPPRRLARNQHLVTVAQPGSSQAERFRLLAATLQLAKLHHGLNVVLVTSAVQQEGKSTSIANLGVALAQLGKKVIIIDLDPYKPMVGRLFRLPGGPGVNDVLVGRAELDDALVSAGLSGESARWSTGDALRILPAGQAAPPDEPSAGTLSLADLMEQLRARADFVLVDTPPILKASDALSLSGYSDGVLVVVRDGYLPPEKLTELRDSLDLCHARKLGVLLTGTKESATASALESRATEGSEPPRASGWQNP